MPTITIIDASTVSNEQTWDLTLLEETVSLAEVIKQRIYQEVSEYNARQSSFFQGLVQPTETERTLNGYELKTPRHLNWNVQYEQALSAFSRRGFIVLVDGRQLTDLTTNITLHTGSTVTFFKLVPLVGG
ncbi:hypothetical protein ccbrp13_19730 [Ktedonobacteria bacterium brp13]|nr:hypothetical protein ccbrp13_19730 [Ktedonobacteria bacterium brp13]